jgi:putative membrane protein insertion efficiency factor
MKKIIFFILINYKKFLSPLLYKLFGHGCRYTPTCSEYGLESIKLHGLIKGIALSIKRFMNCHPFSKRPFFDPVPNNF